MNDEEPMPQVFFTADSLPILEPFVKQWAYEFFVDREVIDMGEGWEKEVMPGLFLRWDEEVEMKKGDPPMIVETPGLTISRPLKQGEPDGEWVIVATVAPPLEEAG